MRYAIERSRYYGAGWDHIFTIEAPAHPTSLGFVGQKGERLRYVLSGQPVEIWEWAERVPLNPADLSCTEFKAGWKLVRRDHAPTPSADELAFYLPGPPRA